MPPLPLGAEIATYLAAQGSLGLTLGSNLFVSVLPDNPDAAVAVYEYGGMAPIMTLTGLGAAESKIDRPNVQIRVRQSMTGLLAGNTTVNAIYGALQGLTEVTLTSGGALFHLISARQSPVFLGRDTKERPEWTLNMQVIWENDQR